MAALTLAGQALEERLRTVEKQQERILALLEDCRQNLQDLEHLCYGNGQEGLKTRVATLEASEKRRATHANVIWGTLTPLVLKALWDILHLK